MVSKNRNVCFGFCFYQIYVSFEKGSLYVSALSSATPLTKWFGVVPMSVTINSSTSQTEKSHLVEKAATFFFFFSF